MIYIALFLISIVIQLMVRYPNKLERITARYNQRIAVFVMCERYERPLRKCLTSLLKQSYAPLEIHVVLDELPENEYCFPVIFHEKKEAEALRSLSDARLFLILHRPLLVSESGLEALVSTYYQKQRSIALSARPRRFQSMAMASYLIRLNGEDTADALLASRTEANHLEHLNPLQLLGEEAFVLADDLVKKKVPLKGIAVRLLPVLLWLAGLIQCRAWSDFLVLAIMYLILILTEIITCLKLRYSLRSAILVQPFVDLAAGISALGDNLRIHFNNRFVKRTEKLKEAG